MGKPIKGNPYLKTDYSYNIRSWTKSISGPLFAQTLYYQDNYAGSTPGGHLNTPSYSGNISAMKWTVPGDRVNDRAYTFDYDALSRLTNSLYFENGILTNHYNTSYSYDKNTNITAISRRGRTGQETFGLLDQLTMTYDGNRLLTLNDAAAIRHLPRALDFQIEDVGSIGQLEIASGKFAYDKNGNQTKDMTRGISSIQYNLLNLPAKLTISNSDGSATRQYLYSADGRKLTTTIQTPGGTLKQDYVGSYIYENGSLKRLLVSGGYIQDGEYYFFIQDHLGNNRVVAKADGTVMQTNHYYPYGQPFAEGAELSNQPYKYNGKEFDTNCGLNLYDYGARLMGPALAGRFTTRDPKTEDYFSISPYAYCLGNPLRFVDPDGMDVWEMDYSGRVRWVSKSKEHTMYALNKKGERTDQSITIQDRAIFDALAATGESSDYKASFAGGSPTELASVFLFGAVNSNAEWRFSRYNTGNGDQYAIGTIHNDELAIAPEQMGFARENEVASIHSHPGVYNTVTGVFSEHTSMGWMTDGTLRGDSWNVDNNSNRYPGNKNLYVYIPYSGNVHQVRGLQAPALIRNIKNHNYNGQRLFWGVLNGK